MVVGVKIVILEDTETLGVGALSSSGTLIF
jgi:hypothetical protein